MSEREEHKALNWVEAHFPWAENTLKAALILAYGAGLDAGLAEAQDELEETRAALLALGITGPANPAAFNARTDELRAAGWGFEADARDRFAGRVSRET